MGKDKKQEQFFRILDAILILVAVLVITFTCSMLLIPVLIEAM